MLSIYEKKQRVMELEYSNIDHDVTYKSILCPERVEQIKSMEIHACRIKNSSIHAAIMAMEVRKERENVIELSK